MEFYNWMMSTLGDYLLVVEAYDVDQPDPEQLPTFLGDVEFWEFADTLALRAHMSSLEVNIIEAPDPDDLVGNHEVIGDC